MLGDYANLTAMGQELRESLLPFWSFSEINLKRYPALIKSAWKEGKKGGASATARKAAGSAGRASWFMVKMFLRMSAMTGAVMAYNQIFHSEAEKDLSEYDQNRMHINLGYNDDGQVRILRTQGSFADFLEWFGLNEAPLTWREFFEGKKSLGEVLLDFGPLPALQKLINALSPIHKSIAEQATGKSWPFDNFKSYPITDRWRQLLRNVQLENEYDAIFQQPSRGYLQSWGMAFVNKTDPQESAYKYIQAQKYAYLETLGKGGSGNYYSPRSIAFRAYKKAIKFGDKEAEDRAWNDMAKAGVTEGDIITMLKRMNPLYGLNKDEKVDFLQRYLSDTDIDKYERAVEYYKEVTNLE